MSFFEKIKKFWVRKVLRRVYDPDKVSSIPFDKMNLAEMKFIMELLYTGMNRTEEDLVKVIDYVSETPTPCDKCFGLEIPDEYCFKCEETGVVRNKHLCSWPWDD